MTELSLTLPVVGEKDTSAEPKVTTAFQEIQTTVNGKIGAVNLEANAVETAKIKAEAVTGPKLGAETLRVLAAAKYEEKNLLKAEVEAGFEFSATRLAFVNTTVGTITAPKVEGKAIQLPVMVQPGKIFKATTAEASVTFVFLAL